MEPHLSRMKINGPPLSRMKTNLINSGPNTYLATYRFINSWHGKATGIQMRLTGTLVKDFSLGDSLICLVAPEFHKMN